MINALHTDPRPHDFKKLVDKYRRVQPVTTSGSNGSNHRYRYRKSVDKGIEPYSGPFGDEQVMHLLHRTLFGVKKSEFESFKNDSLESIIERILKKSGTPFPPANNYNDPSENLIDPDVPEGDTWIEAPWSGELEGPRIISLKYWMVNNIINQESNLHEKMILFWHSFLVTQSWEVFMAKTSYKYFNMLRGHAFGNFKTIIKALTLDPSMLAYLNGTSNNKEAPDENYARELQELFCIGKGADANFTESDVQAAARVLTGWQIEWRTIEEAGEPLSFFSPHAHDITDKQFSSFYNNRIIEGRSSIQGAGELDDMLDMIFDNEETARYLCRRLYRFFVYNEVDEIAEEKVIRPLSEVLIQNNYEVKPVLETLLKSEHFFDESNYGVLIKSPAEFVMGIWRSLEVPTPSLDEDDKVDLLASIFWNMAEKGMELGDPPTVSGWPAYYQSPQFDKSWITTTTVTSRAITTDSLVYWGFWVNENIQLPADLLSFVSKLENPQDPNELINESTKLLFGLKPTYETFQDLKNILLSGQQNDNYWTTAWKIYESDPRNDEYRLIVENRLKSTFQFLLQSAEFNLM